MSSPRLTFLYPHLFRRPFIAVEGTPHPRIVSPLASPIRRRCFHPAGRRLYDTQGSPRTSASHQAIPIPQSGIEGQFSDPAGSQETGDRRPGRSVSEDGGEEAEDHEGDIIDVVPNGSRSSKDDAGEAQPAEPFATSTSLELSTRPLERVLHMEPPTARDDGHGHPHLRPNPYVHHFDTYSLVRDLRVGGFDQQQSITLMKAVRGLLAANMQLAREGLVSKSDVENESYLFSAACSELKTEVENGRRAAAEKMRSERAHLQHEVDNLSQKVGQETVILKDELKGMFDDRRMTVRMEQRSMESKIQELNYKIQSHLNGQSKGEVEGLRWFLTRRTALFIGGLAVAVIISIQYSVHSNHVRQVERQKVKEAEEAQNYFEQGRIPGGPKQTKKMVESTTDTDALLASMELKTGENYVSLG